MRVRHIELGRVRVRHIESVSEGETDRVRQSESEAHRVWLSE